nr:putative ribonuclease H-like domain-containing protein [Tanacetum cinerariifolium]
DLKSFITEIENLVEKKVKIIRCDIGTKFKNRVINKFCEEKGIKREFCVARTPQQNGVAERRNKTLIETTRTMLADSKLPITFRLKQLILLVICKIDGRPEPLFDIDALSKSMNYAPVSTGTNSNDFAGKGASFDAGQSSIEDKHGPSQASKSDNQKRPNAESSTKTVNTVGPVNTATPTYADYPSSHS